MDMTAYVKPGTQERIGIVNDFVSPELTSYIKGLIDEYNTIPWVDSKCGYACSDHSAWTKVGVPSAFAIGASSRYIHPGRRSSIPPARIALIRTVCFHHSPELASRGHIRGLKHPPDPQLGRRPHRTGIQL